VTITDRPPTETPVVTPERRDVLPRLVGGAVLILIGLLWLLERIGAIDISVTAVLALATMLVGIALMVLAGRGSHGGLIVFGTILAVVTLITAASPFEGFQGGVGDRVVELSSVDDIAADYNLAIGTLTIDLRDIDDLEAATALTASVGLGELVVRVPPGTELSVEATVGAGEIEILERVTDGVGLDEPQQTDGFSPDEPGLVLELQSFAGRVEVTDD